MQHKGFIGMILPSAGNNAGNEPVAPPSMFDAHGRRVVIVSGTVKCKQTKKTLRDVSKCEGVVRSEQRVKLRRPSKSATWKS